MDNPDLTVKVGFSNREHLEVSFDKNDKQSFGIIVEKKHLKSIVSFFKGLKKKAINKPTKKHTVKRIESAVTPNV